MKFLPIVVKADYRDGFRIDLTFNDDTKKTVDFSQWLNGPIFEPLRDASYFRRFFLDGGTVSWPNGADIAPETLYEAANEVKTARSRREAKSRRIFDASGRPRRPKTVTDRKNRL